MNYDSEMLQNGAVVSGMHIDGDANMNDLDASLFSALSMDGSNLIPANAGNSFIDSLTGGIGDELNLPFSELDSLVNGANGGECSLAQLTSSLEFELMNTNVPQCGTALPQLPMGGMATARSSNCASPPGNSNQALRRLLTESQSQSQSQPVAPTGAANAETDLCNALTTAEGAKAQRSDLNSTLLQLLIRQQIQQTEQRRILERLQNAILSNDKNALTAACLESEPKSPALSVTASVVTNTSTNASTNASANANVSMNGQQRTGHIQALLETSSPPPNGTAAMRQYAHLSQSELRQTLISTDYQQQMKRGVNVNASANANLVASTPQRNVGQPARIAVGNSAPAGSYINGNANVNMNVRNTSGAGAVPLGFGGSFQPALAAAQPLVTSIVKCETASSVGAYDRRRSGTSTAATSPTSRQPQSAFASSIAGDSEDCGLPQDGDDDADSYSQPTVSGTGQAGAGWASVSGGARRSAHNVIEKRYRSSINDRIGELKQIVAANQPKIQKSGVLRKTVEYIHHLRSQNETLRNENAALKQALLNATANGSSRFEAAMLSNCRDGNAQNEGDTMLIQADSPNAFECYADAQPVSNSHTQGSPQMRADQLLNAPSPPDTMMSSPDAEPPRQARSPPRAAPRAGPHPSKQTPVAPKPAAPATQKLNAVLSGRQLACAALDRTKLLLCVAMVTFVAVNPLDLVTQRVAFGASPSAVDHFAASSLGHAHAHGDFDFAEAHAGARLLSSYEAQPQLLRDDSRTFSILRMAAIWFVNLLVIVAILRRVLSSRCAKCTEEDCTLAQTDKLDVDMDSAFARFKTQADREFASRQFDDARASYKLALAAAGSPCDDSDVTALGELASFFVAYAVNSVRVKAQPSVPIGRLCAVYSRLLLLYLYAGSQSIESHATLRLALNTFRGVQRVHACGKNECVADAYLAVTCAMLALSREQDSSSVVRLALRRVANLAFNCARNASPNEVLRNERFAAFLFEHGTSLRSAVPPAGLSNSLTQLLTGAFLRSLLVGCTSVLRDGDAEAAQEDLEELGRLCQPMEQECEYQFWHAATTLFVQFERNWHDAAQRGVGSLSRVTVRDQLKQQTLLLDSLKRLDSLLQHVTTDCDGDERAVLASGRVASPRTVSIAHLVYRAVRALVVLSSVSQPRNDAFEKLRVYLNSLSKTLQSVRKVVREEAEADSFELNVALCAAKWAVILRVMLCALHREHLTKAASSPQDDTVQTRKTIKRKWIVECQTDLDTFAELNAARAGDEPVDSARGDELEQFEGCLHELADSNPLQSVYVRMRVLAA